jgi:hypothetical protein
MESHQTHEKSDLKIGLLALGAGIVWILLVGTIAHFLAA